MMKSLLKTPLAGACAALATLTGLLASAPSQAVSLSQDAQGQVLLYPYFTVRGGTDTYLSLLNGSNKPILALVRFRASADSAKVYEFLLWLAARDQWTGGVTATAGGAKLISSDQSCAKPSIPAAGLAFASEGSSEAAMDITREGSFEVFELGEVKYQAIIDALQPPTITDKRSCTWTVTPGSEALGPPTGALSGTATLINVAAGTQYSYEPVVLDQFSDRTLWAGATLADANPPTSQVLDKGRVVTSTWDNGTDAVSAVLMHTSLINEFVLEPTTLSGTDWVVSMPTQERYRNDPFLWQTPFAAGKCQYQMHPYDLPYWSREGISDDVEIWMTPPPATPMICNDVSVLTFNNSNLLGSIHGENLETNLDNGWAEFALEGKLVSLENHIYHGLPVTGFMVHDFVNGNVGGLLSNYGGNFEHKYTTVIETP
ncbi:MAG: hypothetical protein ABWY06_23075 [Pseudomonas sp.]|uniref:hypothetical protein n=1 Tax=Pseudomonas sp. TaxID=306 RepID=UPI003397E100